MKKNPASEEVDAFIKNSPLPTRSKLEELRSIVRSMAPDAEERISYKMPVYKYKGQWLVGFSGFKKHVSIFGMSGTFFDPFKDELTEFKTSKGTVQFPLDKPLPVTLIKRLIKARMKLNDEEAG